MSMVPELLRKKSSTIDLSDTSRFEREYVKPIKSIPDSLHTHDILYGGDQNRRKFLIHLIHVCTITYNTSYRIYFIFDNILSVILIWYYYYCIVDREKLVKHHSGHYRHKTAFIWDPHPQYKFTAFGRLFHLVLIQDSKFVSPDIKVSGRLKKKESKH